MGGKTRRLIGGADVYARDTMAGFREAAIAALKDAPGFDLASLKAEQKRLKKRLKRFGDCETATDMWTELGIKDPAAVRDMGDDAFLKLVDHIRGERPMTLDDILSGLFGKGHGIERDGDVLSGHGKLADGSRIAVIGAINGAPLSPKGALQLAGHVLDVVGKGGETPILVLVDTEGQLMARPRRDARPQRISQPSRQVPAAGEPRGPSHHWPGIRQGGRRVPSSPPRWRPMCWWPCPAPSRR